MIPQKIFCVPSLLKESNYSGFLSFRIRTYLTTLLLLVSCRIAPELREEKSTSEYGDGSFETALTRQETEMILRLQYLLHIKRYSSNYSLSSGKLYQKINYGF